MDSSAEIGKSKLIPLQFLDFDASACSEKPISVHVSGTIPKWLKRSLYRNGSGVFKVGCMSWKHLFDGFAVLHCWAIQDGSVTYLSKVLDTDHYVKCVKHNRLVGNAFGSSFPDPCKSIFERFFSYFVPGAESSDNTSVNIVEFGDRLFALGETKYINEINPDTMSKKQQTDISELVAVHIGTAHPHVDKDGTMYYYGTCMNYKKAYNFVKIPPRPQSEPPFSGAEIIATIPSSWKLNISYTHSFGMTPNFFVHAEQPFAINILNIMTMKMTGSDIADCISFFKDEPLHFYVINKTTGKMVPIVFKAPFGLILHFINCYEESGNVVCDVALYEHGDILQDLYLDKICSDQFEGVDLARFSRFVLPLSLDGAQAGENLVTLPRTRATAVLRDDVMNVVDVTCDKMFGDLMFELPRINAQFNGLKYRYAYGSTLTLSHPKVMKFDLEGKTISEWTADASHITGEPVFIPRPGATKEDDGVVLCPIVANTTEHSSFLLVLDAETFQEIGRASTPAHVKMVYTFHGHFINKVI